jgi:1-acyl-sn-glycerol-3-phosphate acyltransferase
MIYTLFHFIFKTVIKLRFKSVNLNHQEFLDSRQPLIIVANHGNSFLDAILLAIVFERKLHFLARADVFNSKFKIWFLGKLNMMPIYRIRDGRDVLKNNDLIFARCTQILQKNGAILIFPEGNCVVEKRLRNFKTGFVNLAYEANVKNLAVLPISLNYGSLKTLNTNVDLVFNDLIVIEDLKLKNQDFVSFSKELLTRSKLAISNQMVQINNAFDEGFYNQIFTIIRNNVIREECVFAQITASNYLDNLKENDYKKFEKLSLLSSTYFEDLMILKVDDVAINKQFSDAEELTYYVLLPFYYLGKLINVLPSLIVNSIVNKRIKELQFKNSVKLVLSPFVYGVFMLLAASFFGVSSHFTLLLFLLLFIIILIYAYTKNVMDIFIQLIFIKSKYLTSLKEKRAEILKVINL